VLYNTRVVRLHYIGLTAALTMQALFAQGVSDATQKEADKLRELELWRTAKEINSPAVYADYLRQFPEGTFAVAAKALIEKLRDGVTAPSLGNAGPKVSAAAPQQGLASVNDALTLLGKVQVAVGGAERLASVRNYERTEVRQAKGPLQPGPSRLTERWCATGADLLQMEGRNPNKQFLDGKTGGWFYSHGRIDERSDLSRQNNQAQLGQWFHLLLADSLPGYQVASAGENLLRIDDGRDDALILEVDPATFLPVRLMPVHAGATSSFSKWEPVDGLRLPSAVALRSEDLHAEYTLTWKINTTIDCPSLGRKPAGAKPAIYAPLKPADKTPEIERRHIGGDTSAQAAVLLARMRQRLGGDEALLNIHDYERVIQQRTPARNGKMQSIPKRIESGCITGETYDRTPRAIGPSEETYFDGNTSGWVAVGGKSQKMPKPVVRYMQKVAFDYDVFKLALSDQVPGRQLSLIDEATLLVLDPSGAEARITIDATGLPIKRVSKFVSKDVVAQPVEEQFSDWRMVHGVLLPFHLVGYRGDRLEREVTVQEWKLNQGINCVEIGAKHPL
jgi:hypothetical protein